jgi:mannosyltransferase OCH1-like enzyme
VQSNLPKKIWFLWLQGADQMPEVVQRCFESWRRYNSDWEIIFLDENNLHTYIDIEELLAGRPIEMPRVSLSEIVRINVLQKHGGVWVDASCYCCEPLDNWLHEKVNPSGFFAFSQPGIDRMISSWFLAAVPGNIIVEKYASTVNEFFKKYNALECINKKKGINWLLRRTRLNRWLNQNPTYWLNFWFQGVLKIYPYYWFHYTFEKIYQNDSAFCKTWDNTPKLSANKPHLLWNHGLDRPIYADTKKKIKEGYTPLFKLTWKVNDAMYQKGNALHYLLYESGL